MSHHLDSPLARQDVRLDITDPYGAKVARRVFPNILPYEVGTAAAFDLMGWNGRALTDNAPEVMCSIAANTAVPIGVGASSVPTKPSKAFPYVPAAG
jgi:hypothetical protein